jgi:hypothetical protein
MHYADTKFTHIDKAWERACTPSPAALAYFLAIRPIKKRHHVLLWFRTLLSPLISLPPAKRTAFPLGAQSGLAILLPSRWTPGPLYPTSALQLLQLHGEMRSKLRVSHSTVWSYLFNHSICWLVTLQ